MRQIYLDYNATTPIAPSVQEAMQPFLADAVYVNYLGDEGEDRVRNAYPPAKYERLVALIGGEETHVAVPLQGSGTSSSKPCSAPSCPATARS